MKNYTQIQHVEHTEGCRCEKCNLIFSTNDSLKRPLRIAMCKAHIEGLHCEKCNNVCITNQIQFNHPLGPKCHKHTKKGSSGQNKYPACCIGQYVKLSYKYLLKDLHCNSVIIMYLDYMWTTTLVKLNWKYPQNSFTARPQLLEIISAVSSKMRLLYNLTVSCTNNNCYKSIKINFLIWC